MDAVDVLMEARAYIEKGWCQRRAGFTSEGLSVTEPADMHKAARRCVVGAVWTVIDPREVIADKAVGLLLDATGQTSLADWNDASGRTQEEVLEAFDRAIGLGLERAGER